MKNEGMDPLPEGVFVLNVDCRGLTRGSKIRSRYSCQYVRYKKVGSGGVYRRCTDVRRRGVRLVNLR